MHWTRKHPWLSSRFMSQFRSGGFKLQMLDEWNAPQFFVLTKQIDNLQKFGQNCTISKQSSSSLPGMLASQASHLHVAISREVAFAFRL